MQAAVATWAAPDIAAALRTPEHPPSGAMDKHFSEKFSARPCTEACRRVDMPRLAQIDECAAELPSKFARF